MMRSSERPAPAASRLGARARVGDREAQRLALGAARPLQVEPDAADRRRAGLDDGVGNLARVLAMSSTRTSTCCCATNPRETRRPLREVELPASSRRPTSACASFGIPQLAAVAPDDGRHRVGVLPLRVARALGARFDGDRDERHVRRPLTTAAPLVTTMTGG